MISHCDEILLRKCARESITIKCTVICSTNSSMQSTSYIPSKYFNYTFRFKFSGNDFIELLCRSIFAMQTKNTSRFKRKDRGQTSSFKQAFQNKSEVIEMSAGKFSQEKCI